MESNIQTPDTSGILLAKKIHTSEEVTAESIKQAYNEWNAQCVRYRKLKRYYLGVQTLPGVEHPVVSNLCYYIVNAFKGYLVGNPPAYENAPDDPKAQEITELYHKQNKAQVEADIVQDQSTYGSAVELVYLSDDPSPVPKSTVLSPMDAFVAYAGDVEEDSVFGAVRYKEKISDKQSIYKLYVYTRTDVQLWTSNSESGDWTMQGEPIPHGFGRVPLIEYVNNKERMGDFEQVISLQDAYNRLLTDRIDDKDAFVKSILIITGNVIGKSDKEVEESVKNIQKNRVMQFDDADGNASYLEKSMDEAGVQVLQDQLKNDLHKLAMIPDLSDEQFASNASGVAMAYKLFGTDQKVAEKVAQLQKGYTRRCKLYDYALHNPMRAENTDTGTQIEDMRIVFKLNAPQDLSYMATSLTMLTSAGIISKQTSRAQLAIVTDVERETQLVKDEQNEQADLNRQAFEDDFTSQAEEDEAELRRKKKNEDEAEDDEE